MYQNYFNTLEFLYRTKPYTPVKTNFYLLLLFSLFTQTLLAQKKITVSGTIRDADTGETLVGATAQIKALKTGATSNEYGFYSVSINKTENMPDTATVVFTYIGYVPQVRVIRTNRDTVLNLSIGASQELGEVVIEANSARERVNSTQMSLVTITTKEAKILPAFLGEVDILRTLQLKPGVLSGGEGISGMYVRGGGSDQNLFILDEAPVYNPSHLFGLFSTFNSDAVKNVELYKGGFPAQYGGRLSSVIDVSLNDGNRRKFSGSGGIGLISSRLTLEGPLKKDKGSFIVSGRRTYVDLITNLVNKVNEDNPSFSPIPAYSFYDLNAKFNYDIDDKNKIFLSGYFGRDNFVFKTTDFNFQFYWGNATATARWNHVFNPKLFSNVVFTFSDYVYKISNTFDQFQFSLGSGIRDYNLKYDFSWFPSSKHVVKFGANAIYHDFLVSSLQASNKDNTFNLEAGSRRKAGDFALYANDDWHVNSKLSVNTGLRLSGFTSGSKFYTGIEPRVSAKYSLTEDLSVKGSYNRMYQYIHLVANSAATLPTDIWYPSNATIKPQSSDQIAGGVSYALGRDWFVSGEGFYKWLWGQIDFRDGAQLFANDNLDDEFVFGKGKSYGGEFYLEKKNGKVTGWIGYSLTWVKRKFQSRFGEPAINNGEYFYPRYDRRHDINVVVMYQPHWRWTLSTTFSYGTGNAFSLPDGRAVTLDNGAIGNIDANAQSFYNFNIAPVYTARNKYRLPANYHWDLSVVMQLFKPEKKLQGDLTLSVYNMTDRRNPFFIYIAPQDADDNGIPERFQARLVSLLPILPTVTFNFKF